MTPLARLLVRSALVALVAAALLGAALSAGVPGARRLLPLHQELATVGFLVQLALGVATWMLPRPLGAGHERRDPALGRLAWSLLVAGVVAAGLAGSGALPGACLVAGRLAEAAALVLLALALLPRVRAAIAGAAHAA